MQEMKVVVVLVGLMCVGCAINQRHEVSKPVSRLPALEDASVASNDRLHEPILCGFRAVEFLNASEVYPGVA